MRNSPNEEGERSVHTVEPILLGGEDGIRSKTVAIHNPYSGATVGEVCYADKVDAAAACALAERAFTETKRLSSWERAAILNRVADKLVEQTAKVAEMIMLEAGKPITDAMSEVARSIQTFRVAAEEASASEETSRLPT